MLIYRKRALDKFMIRKLSGRGTQLKHTFDKNFIVSVLWYGDLFDFIAPWSLVPEGVHCSGDRHEREKAGRRELQVIENIRAL